MDERLIEAFNSAFQDIYQFDHLMWCLLILALDAKGIITKEALEQGLETSAEQANPRVAGMLRGIVETLRDPDVPPPRWTPQIIKGGKE